MKTTKIINHSLEADWQILQWFNPRFYNDFLVEAVVLPDVCPAGIIPNGTMAIVKKDWLSSFAFREAIGDIGCAMSHGVIVNFNLDLLPTAWNHLYRKLKGLNKTILGSGNHFIDACINQNNELVILVHVGSRMTSPEKKEFNYNYDYQNYLDRAFENHAEIWDCIREILGDYKDLIVLPHDTVIHDGGFMVLRKGVTHSPVNAPILIASSFDDVITLGKANHGITEIGCSMSHGTGRCRSRGEAKEVEIDQKSLRQRIIIPDELDDNSWRLESPIHYRRSEDILQKIDSFIQVTDQLLPIAFMGGF
ncbi:RtcB family protein [Planktothrix mougeotii]|uniref:3'-phosphate/5'-hydroxy nucleic acid ligase n=1 Tax=Planktothrix mougeotii LEGE 06226 TaxID=1828728 RepID=A0ABR9ULJ9_9CYAN|nr:RtcB family protein [Planktothrix mougeotii]MBE9146671.1 RtcB family protein [Planktothrix mougeotii LEGE 06226]